MRKTSALSKRKLLFDKIICLIFSCFLLLAFEVTARTFFNQEDALDKILLILKQDPLLFWKQRSDLNTIFQGVGVRTNKTGLRNRDINPIKKNDELRVVCMGASATFGWGVNGEDTYPYLLEKNIQEYNYRNQLRHIEVINAGVIGYTSYQGSLLLKSQILDLSPDIITVSYMVNDMDKWRFYRNNGKSDHELKPKNRALVMLENMLERSKLYRLLKKNIIPRQRFYLNGAGMLEKRRVPQKEYRDNLREIIDLARKNKIKVVFIKMPMLTPHKLLIEKAEKKELLECVYLSHFYNKIMQEVALENNIPLVDVVTVFDNFPPGDNRVLFIDPDRDLVHPNAMGHHLIASAIYKTFAENNLIENEPILRKLQ